LLIARHNLAPEVDGEKIFAEGEYSELHSRLLILLFQAEAWSGLFYGSHRCKASVERRNCWRKVIAHQSMVFPVGLLRVDQRDETPS
jgi:hypothetical protein